MKSQAHVNQLIKQWESAYRTISGDTDDARSKEEISQATSTLVWTLIQLKDAGYQLSEENVWQHRSELHLYRAKVHH
jgi:hypothetical protein